MGFLSRTFSDLASQLAAPSTPVTTDVESNNSRNLPRWFSGSGLNRSQKSSKLSGPTDEKISQDKTKKLGTFSGVCLALS